MAKESSSDIWLTPASPHLWTGQWVGGSCTARMASLSSHGWQVWGRPAGGLWM